MAEEKKLIECVECHRMFVFPPNEQAFYKKKGFSDPKRCKVCRAKKREEKKTEPKDKEWGNCESCGNWQPLTEAGMCGPCTFGEADTIDGNW